jgi:hypothetical protein
VVKCERNRDRLFKSRLLSIRHNNKTRGRVVNTRNDTFVEPRGVATFPEPQGFTIQDILWAVGVWSVILSLSPVIVFYMLMVA